MNFEEFSKPIGQHQELNPELWDEPEHRLKSSVRGALLRIAEDFIKFVNVPMDVKDVVITGGNANYTYTDASDIDLHIIIDYNQVKCDRAVHELMDSKRLLYREYRDVRVFKIPVELYVEDENKPAVSSGCFSILHNSWIKQPTAAQPYDEEAVKSKVSMWETIIDHAVKTKDLSTARTAMKLIKDYRTLGLRTPEGEFSVPNLTYKSLRNGNKIRALQQQIDIAHDRDLSI